MKAKIDYGMYHTICDFTEPEELSEEFIEFPNLLITVVKVDGELEVVNAIDEQGNNLTSELAPYTLNIKYL